MTDPSRFTLHRPELEDSLLEGERKVRHLMRDTGTPVAAGKTLIRAGSTHDYVYRLVSGWACRTRQISDGRDQIILVFLPGDLFAVKSMLLRWHTDDVRMLSDGVIERLEVQALHTAFRDDPDIANRCMWQVVEEERRLHSWVFGLGQGTAEERLAYLLIDFRGRLALSGVIERGALRFPLPFTQVQLADHLGITHVHVNRVLRTFRASGIAELREGEALILNLEELARRARPLMDVYEKGIPEYIDTDHPQPVSK
jgi:CRP/FNR family transcriptional regulator, anaerobic regulatory protein